MTDYTELKASLRNGIDFDDSKEAADAIESLESQIAELSKYVVPVAYMSGRNGFICKENKNPEYNLPLFTHPANPEAAIVAAYAQGKRDALVAQGELIAQEIAAAPKQET